MGLGRARAAWAGQGAGAAARRAARTDLPSPLTFMPISISSAACPRPGMLAGLGSLSQGGSGGSAELQGGGGVLGWIIQGLWLADRD